MTKFRLLLMAMTMICQYSIAEEGMWIPSLIEQINFQYMQDLGLEQAAMK